MCNYNLLSWCVLSFVVLSKHLGVVTYAPNLLIGVYRGLQGAQSAVEHGTSSLEEVHSGLQGLHGTLSTIYSSLPVDDSKQYGLRAAVHGVQAALIGIHNSLISNKTALIYGNETTLHAIQSTLLGSLTAIYANQSILDDNSSVIDQSKVFINRMKYAFKENLTALYGNSVTIKGIESVLETIESSVSSDRGSLKSDLTALYGVLTGLHGIQAALFGNQVVLNGTTTLIYVGNTTLHGIETAFHSMYTALDLSDALKQEQKLKISSALKGIHNILYGNKSSVRRTQYSPKQNKSNLILDKNSSTIHTKETIGQEEPTQVKMSSINETMSLASDSKCLQPQNQSMCQKNKLGIYDINISNHSSDITTQPKEKNTENMELKQTEMERKISYHKTRMYRLSRQINSERDQIAYSENLNGNATLLHIHRRNIILMRKEYWHHKQERNRILNELNVTRLFRPHFRPYHANHSDYKNNTQAAYKIEIFNIPEASVPENENLMEVLQKLGNIFGCGLKGITRAYRRPGFWYPRNIVVEMISKSSMMFWLIQGRAHKVKLNQLNATYPNKQVQVIEYLSSSARNLKKAAKQISLSKGYKHFFVKNGRTFIQKDDWHKAEEIKFPS